MEPNEDVAKAYKKHGIDYYTLSKIRDGRVVDFLGDEKFRIGRFTPEDFYGWMDRGVNFALQAKKPIQINCHAGVNRAPSVLASYLMTKPRPFTYDRTIELLEAANKKRDYDVLTNREFRQALRHYPTYYNLRKYGGKTSKVSRSDIMAYSRYVNQYKRRPRSQRISQKQTQRSGRIIVVVKKKSSPKKSTGGKKRKRSSPTIRKKK